MTESQEVIVSGIQSTGLLHIGNLFGAIQNWARRQEEYKCYIFVADLHALTTPDTLSPSELQASKRAAVAAYLACGINPERSVIFCQSDVPQHPYAGWLMTCATPIGWLERMTQFKTKAQRGERESVSAGLLTYPALQAADIVLYGAKYVPTGEDQKQHLEYTRNLVERFNTLYGAELTVPQPLIEETGSRIMGLDEPDVKMSKSVSQERPAHAVMLSDDNDTIRYKIRRAVTDSGERVDPMESGSGVQNLVEIYAGCMQMSRQWAWKEVNGLKYGKLKNHVSDALIERLGPIREEYLRLIEDVPAIDNVIADGGRKAREVASVTLEEMRRVVGA